MTLKAYIIAGELSGDQLGAHLIDGLRAETEVSLSGIGGPMMQARGFRSLFEMSELSVMGLTEVLPRLPGLLRRIKETAADVLAVAPDVLITIDSPDFCLRVAKRVKAVRPDLKVVHYVAPSVWAWRPKRAEKMARHVDHVLALLPFEPPLMKAAGMSCDFVGHPIATRKVVGAEARAAFRAELGISEGAPLLCVLPGSRAGEIARHSEVFRQVLAGVKAQMPDFRMVLPAAGPVLGAVREAFGGIDGLTILEPDEGLKWAGFAASDAALAVSGTVSIELASQNTPMVIGYDASALTKAIMKRAFLLDTATLVNIVSETRAVPEFIFERFQADLIVPELLGLLRERSVAQENAARVTMERLGRGGLEPGRRAAQSVLRFIQ